MVSTRESAIKKVANPLYPFIVFASLLIVKRGNLLAVVEAGHAPFQ